MKSLTIKIPLSIAQQMDDNGHLNPQWIANFLEDFIDIVPEQHINELTYTYTFKVENKLHKAVKLKSIEYDIPMNEMVGRLLVECYDYA